jgi:hypothetical protein
MAITWGERPNGIKRNINSLTIGYILAGVTDKDIAYALAAGYSATIAGGLLRQDIDLQENTFDSWKVDVTYGTSETKKPEVGDFKWSFDTTGKTKHITQALAHVNSYVPSGATAVNHKGAIGVTDEGEVQGVDVPDKTFKWTETWQLLLADYGFSYSSILGDYTGRMNSGTFRGKPAYTVLFDGAVGSQSAKDPLILEVTYHFEYSQTLSGVTVGDITGIAKDGWNYAWVRYEQSVDASAKKLTLKPCQVDVDRVLEYFDFSLLGIGTAVL